jgi:very-short-patch-repair endonuclease
MRKAKRTDTAKKAAKRLRRQPTDAESKLWYHLRRKQIDGHRFRRQSPVGPYVVDFLCVEAGLIVEVDGGQHSWRAEDDAKRTNWLESQGYRVVRFWNNEVSENIEGVLETIFQAALKTPPPQPSPSEEGEGVDAPRQPEESANG